ncbi:glycosyl hydrolase family 61-domain-containing protein [Cercophora newfieldiana]|uniref:lytic cellulose monooxygenase (C4-dehydrogenating) n=1 Tax=Cercophora newfieldiana TaxID=92897 RepID=A0AA39XWA8_9PEZI|nr:glycosyl hydrolase family 61-domain-containing protein [Cercophora newfieldiana]
MPSSTLTLLAGLAGAATVAAHGHVTNIVINGDSYSGFLPNIFPYQANPPIVAGWTAANTDNGFVGPESFASADIICHKSATNAEGHAVVAAGDSIFVQWDTWPESHKGPVIDYLANCGAAGCESVDKAALEFFKIDEAGLIDGSQAPGKWASDQLIANNNSWMVKIPANIAPGFYVLRHEIIALHSAGQQNGAQNYPQCFNLQVTGGGSATPAGVKGTALYTPNDAGILFNIYTQLASYPIPGPALIAGASAVAQGSSSIKASATAITGSAVATAAPAPATTTAAAPTTLATTTSAAAAPTTAAAAPTTTSSAAAVLPTTTSAAAVQPTVAVPDCAGTVTVTITEGPSGPTTRARGARTLAS